MKIALFYRTISDTDRPLFEALLDKLYRHGASVADLHGLSPDQSTPLLADADFLLSVGGDGTLLATIQLNQNGSIKRFPPIVGINFGHLGFLTTAGRADVEQLVEDLMQGNYTIEQRSLIEVKAPHTYALNEIYLHRSEAASFLRTQLYVDDQYVATYSGDGVIVATPTGSTAYSLSCGGPILTPDSGCLVITPIGAHTLTLRPLIVPDSAHIRLQTYEGGVSLGIDSQLTTLEQPTTLSLVRAPFAIRLIRCGSQSFFSAIRDKLMWGTEVR